MEAPESPSSIPEAVPNATANASAGKRNALRGSLILIAGFLLSSGALWWPYRPLIDNALVELKDPSPYKVLPADFWRNASPEEAAVIIMKNSEEELDRINLFILRRDIRGDFVYGLIALTGLALSVALSLRYRRKWPRFSRANLWLSFVWHSGDIIFAGIIGITCDSLFDPPHTVLPAWIRESYISMKGSVMFAPAFIFILMPNLLKPASGEEPMPSRGDEDSGPPLARVE